MNENMPRVLIKSIKNLGKGKGRRGPESEVMDGTSTGGQVSMLSKESIELQTYHMLSGKNA
jgi:hypothetical protein